MSFARMPLLPLGSVVCLMASLPTFGQEDAQSTRFEKNKAAYNHLLKAQEAETFRIALSRLSNIDDNEVTDENLKESVDFCRRCARLCIAVGITETVPPEGLRDLLKRIDYVRAFQSMLSRGVLNAPRRAAELFEEGITLSSKLSDFIEAMSALDEVYGS